MRNHDHRITQLERTQSPGPLTVQRLISDWPQEEAPGPLPWAFADAEACIDHAARNLPTGDRARFAAYMKTGTLPEDPSEGLYRALLAELLVEGSLALRVGEAPLRKRRRGWV